jgi:hypothetical protein
MGSTKIIKKSRVNQAEIDLEQKQKSPLKSGL